MSGPAMEPSGNGHVAANVNGHGEHPVIDEAEIVVVGGGPAGAATAARLAELGHDVLIVDQHEFPRDKVCGDGVTDAGVDYLEMMGLDDLVESSWPIEGARFTFEYRRSALHRLGRRRKGKSVKALCTPRYTFDSALADAAKERGARMTVARATGPLMDGERLLGIAVNAGGKPAAIRARYAVAADGPTSRMRRELGLGRERKVSSYGIRQYYRTEKSLEPYWDFYVPIELEDFGIAAYGWVFPIEEHVANVGLGLYRGPTLGDRLPIREVFKEFLDKLMQTSAGRFGDMEPAEDRPLGSPVAIGFSPDHCQRGDVFLVGDAARTTDPLTGEGIANACTGGHMVAELVHELATRKTPVPDIGRHLSRRLPQVAGDITPLARWAVLGANSDQQAELNSDRDESWEVVKRICLLSGQFDPSWMRTPIGRLTAELDPVAADALREVNNAALDLAATPHMFFQELMAREMLCPPGPLNAAAILLVARACGADPSEAHRALATSTVISASVSRALVDVEDRPRTNGAEGVNAAILLFSDFAMSRACVPMAEIPAEVVAQISRSLMRSCEVTLARKNDRYDLSMPRERYEATADEVAGTMSMDLIEFAAQLSGASEEVVNGLREFAREAGRAYLAAAEIRELLDGDDHTDRHPAFFAARGYYSLPILLARDDVRVRQALMRGVERGDVPELVDAIRETGAFDAVLEECRERVQRAVAILDDIPLERPELMRSLAEFAAEWAGSGELSGAAAAANGGA